MRSPARSTPRGQKTSRSAGASSPPRTTSAGAPRSSCTTRSGRACSASRPTPPRSPRSRHRCRRPPPRRSPAAPASSPGSSSTCKASTGASSTGSARWRSAMCPSPSCCPNSCSECAGSHSAIAFTCDIDGFAPSYGDTVDLTLYRCVQESLTNAIRHAGASAVTVTAREAGRDEAGARLELTVRDNGHGFRAGQRAGLRPARHAGTGAGARRHLCNRDRRRWHLDPHRHRRDGTCFGGRRGSC